MDIEIYWIIGLIFISLIGGGIFSWAFFEILRKYMNVPKEIIDDEGGTRRFPPWLTGVIERLFFTLIIGFDMSGVPAAMMIWLTVKMVTNWNRPLREKSSNTVTIRRSFLGLLSGLISMTFAVIGGMYIQSA